MAALVGSGALVAVLLPVVGAATLMSAAQQAQAAPGTPGTPSPPTVLFNEDFENAGDSTNVLLPDYRGARGASYSADPFWKSRNLCNGFIIDRTSPRVPGDCSGTFGDAAGESIYNSLTALVDSLGRHAGVPDPAHNAAAASFTSGGAENNLIQFQTNNPLTLPAANRFVTFSVDAVATNCFAAHPLLRFYLKNAAGAELPVSSSPIDPCTDPRSVAVDGTAQNGAVIPTRVGTFAANSSMLLTGDQLGIVMRNETGDGTGNDGAYDNIRVLDVTPQLDKAFAPTKVPVGGTSTLTFTITNTSELAAKEGWSFTDNLPAGLVVDDPASASTTCTNGVVTAGAGSGSIHVEGDLLANQASCTATVNVTSDTPRGDDPSSKTYENSADNIVDAVGMNAPGSATVEFYSQRSLKIEKTSDANAGSRVGDTVKYTIKATNTGTGDYTADAPAQVTDDLSEVVDDATLDQSSLTASRPGDPSYTAPKISWTGPLPAGQTVELSYTVTLKSGGDGKVRNVAFDGPPTKPTPKCDPPTDGGLDPDTGTPCARHSILLPQLTITKTADRKDLPAVGEKLTYTVVVKNTGPGAFTEDAPATVTDDMTKVLDDATFDESSLSATSGDASYSEPKIEWEGAMAAGASVTLTYSVTYTGEGDHLLVNSACVPAGDVAPGSAPCGSLSIPAAYVEDWKTVDPASTKTVEAGNELTYTLHFSNTGKAAGAVNKVDDLTHVLDDATVTAEPASSDPALKVTAIADKRYAVTGTLAPGQTVTVTYKAKVKAYADQGDHELANFLLKPGAASPSTPDCKPADPKKPDCTINPVGHVVAAKTVNPKTGTPVKDGQTLTYTLSFTNDGAGTAKVDYTDHLAGVTDDAYVVAQPKASSDALTASRISRGAFTVTGGVRAGVKVKVTYQVKVKAYAQQGDHNLGNFLTEDGAAVPKSCVKTNSLCTQNPTIKPAAATPVSPPVDPPVNPPLPDTGANVSGLAVVGGIGLLLAGVMVLTVIYWRRRRIWE